jgi:PfaB family protein
MDLKLTGMALSLQWTPSLKQVEYSLTGKYQPLPSLVEHPGEVIQKALEDIPNKGDTILIHIHLGVEAEFGYYESLLNEQFQTLKRESAQSPYLIQVLEQAAGYLKNEHRLVVVSETGISGTTAVVLASPDSLIPGIVSLSSWPSLDGRKQGFEYIGVASPPDPDDLEILAQQLVLEAKDYSAVLGSFNAPRRDGEALAAFIQTALAIKNKILPAWINNPLESVPQSGRPNLQISGHSRPWLSLGMDFKRKALFAQTVLNESAWKLVLLEEIPRQTDVKVIRTIPKQDPILIPLSGYEYQDFLKKLENLETLLEQPGSLKTIADNAYTNYSRKREPLTCCLLGNDRQSLRKEISHAKSGLANALETGQIWNSPAGSYFTPQPLGEYPIAFVYPGAFNSYPGMARELFFAFPGLQDAVQKIIPDLRHSLAEEFLYLGGPNRDPSLPDEQQQAVFYDHPDKLIESGISISVLYTLLLREVFHLRPQAALGYSLGEASMLWANQVWQNAQDSSQKWQQSRLFKDQLAGEMVAVQKYLKRDLPPDFWTSYILKAAAEDAEAACQQEPMAFLTIQNTADEVVIAGVQAACQRVIDRLECRALPMPFKAAIHNPTLASSSDDFLDLYRNPTTKNPDICFYSAAEYQELELTEKNLSQKMTDMTIHWLDFPRLVNQVYDDGARIFIEVGPQKTCSRWIGTILSGKPHAAIPINKKYQSDVVGILKVLSLLVSHGVQLDLDALYQRKLPDPASTSVVDFQKSTERKTAEKAQAPLSNTSQASGSLNTAYFQHLDRLSEGIIRSHQSYLKEQGVITENLLKVATLQQGFPSHSSLQDPDRRTLYSRQQIQAFTTGDPEVCFGDLFQGFEGRRIPLLPNGPLQFIDRVVDINGQFGKVKTGASLVSEFDLPANSWYKTRESTIVPHVALMEIALQPCGFLSAYMGSILGKEGQDLYFRNLDGEATLLDWPENPTGPLTNQVELISSSSLGDVIIQKYSFELYWGKQPFITGSSSFGYFTLPMLQNQQGLDSGKDQRTWKEEQPEKGSWVTIDDHSLPLNGTPRLPSPQRIWIARKGGRHGQGYLYLRQPIPKQSWFYSAHFHQDPVMPGSLGVETMAAALQTAAALWDIPKDLDWRMAADTRLDWKYRGQISPDNGEITVELHIKSVKKKNTGWEINADGQLWKGSKRIYQVDNLSLETYPLSQESKR